MFSPCVKQYCFANNGSENASFYRATDPGSGPEILSWRRYEEPLQTSCLGTKHTLFYMFDLEK